MTGAQPAVSGAAYVPHVSIHEGRIVTGAARPARTDGWAVTCPAVWLSREHLAALRRGRDRVRERRQAEEVRRLDERLREAVQIATGALLRLAAALDRFSTEGLDDRSSALAAAAARHLVLEARLADASTDVDALLVAGEAERLRAIIFAGPGAAPAGPVWTEDRCKACCALRQFRDRLTATEVDPAPRRWAVVEMAAMWERTRALARPFAAGAFAAVGVEVADLNRQLDRVLAEADMQELGFRRRQMVERALLAAMGEESVFAEDLPRPGAGSPRRIHARTTGGRAFTATVETDGSLSYSGGDQPAREPIETLHQRLNAMGVRTGPLCWEPPVRE